MIVSIFSSGRERESASGGLADVQNPLNQYFVKFAWGWTSSLGSRGIHDLTVYPVLRIHDILVWIRIHTPGSMPLTNGSGSKSRSLHKPSRRQQKTNFCKSFSAYYFLKAHLQYLHHFPKKKSEKRSHKSVGINVFLTIFLDDRKIRSRIRIRTAY